MRCLMRNSNAENNDKKHKQKMKIKFLSVFISFSSFFFFVSFCDLTSAEMKALSSQPNPKDWDLVEEETKAEETLFDLYQLFLLSNRKKKSQLKPKLNDFVLLKKEVIFEYYESFIFKFNRRDAMESQF